MINVLWHFLKFRQSHKPWFFLSKSAVFMTFREVIKRIVDKKRYLKLIFSHFEYYIYQQIIGNKKLLQIIWKQNNKQNMTSVFFFLSTFFVSMSYKISFSLLSPSMNAISSLCWSNLECWVWKSPSKVCLWETSFEKLGEIIRTTWNVTMK